MVAGSITRRPVWPDSGAGTKVAQIMTDHVVSCAPGITTGEASKILLYPNGAK